IRRSLEPVWIVWRLLRGEDFHETVAEEVHAIRAGDVPVERRRIELRQHEDPADVGVHAVADRNVDETVLATDRYRRLRSELRQREHPHTLSTSENERKHFVVHCHDKSRWYTVSV